MFTAIVSDLHLCEAEPVHPKFPLWKKFKTREFFFDDIFSDFLKHLEMKSGGQPVELILNGDIFDFDCVLSLPTEPAFRISWLETQRGLFPRPERARFKMQVIARDHDVFFKAMRDFILRGNNVVLITGNHDLELHFPEVKEEILSALNLPEEAQSRFRFSDWFYISNKDTLIEHGNQYDPYCVCEDPVHPFLQGYNYKTMRLPFGNLTCRYMINGMGFFNPHVDSNYIMTLSEYVRFFLKYVVRAQPGLLLTWFWGSMITLWHSLVDRFDSPIRDPLRVEDRVNDIAARANAEPRMVRELRELFVTPATNNPFLIARELWLDRAFLVLVAFFLIFELMILIRQVFEVSFFWAFIPLFLLLPFFIFYSKSVVSMVSSYKEPDERILSTAGAITHVSRIVYGHTHVIRHEMIGPIEHLNSGCWSPAFLDVECTRAVDTKTFVWIEPSEEGRRAQLLTFKDGESFESLAASRLDRRKST
jgi:UDP-2,3-diacylglucosamine pyrophosphatase LpxH